MSEILYGLVGAIGVPALLFLWQLLLKRERVLAWGMLTGTFCRVFLRQKFGVAGGDRLLDRMTSTVADFVEGVQRGLRGDVPAH